MTEREAELRSLVENLREREDVVDAFLAKSFTDRLVIVDHEDAGPVPGEIVDALEEHDLVGVNDVYRDDGADVSFAGAVGDATRHQFVDVRTRGDHQSYVVD